MPNAAITRAVDNAARETVALPDTPNPMARNSHQRGLVERLAQLIPAGETCTEAEAIARIEKATGRSEPRDIIINGTSGTIALLVDLRFWRWSDMRAGVLERTPSEHVPTVVRSIYVHSGTAEDPKMRSLREELGILRRTLLGHDEPRASFHLQSGCVLVRNPFPYPVRCIAVGRELEPFEILETDAATARLACETGVFQEIEPDAAAQLIADAGS